MKIILASKSPRRRQLLSEIISDFDIEVCPCDESLPSSVHPREGVEILAVRKGEEIAKKYPDRLIISSDTLVELDGVALGKPRDEAEAMEMLNMLSAKAHNVHTGVAVHYGGKVFSGVDSTRVIFKALTYQEIKAYIESGEPMDKAGSYGIQGLGGRFVEGYEGRFDTVVGLSVKLTEELINEAKKYEN